MPGPNLGDVFPNFSASSTIGPLKFHDYVGDSWCILFSHPADYTPVCTTELARSVELHGEFDKRGVKLLALSCNDVESHKGWSKDVLAYTKKGGDTLPYPIVADEKRDLAVALGMIDPDEKDKDGLPLTARAVFVVGPDKKLKLSLLYPATTGRNFTELLRVVDSLQLTATKKVATPVDWKRGDDCMVVPSVAVADEKKIFPKGVRTQEVPSKKTYLRFTPHPAE